MKNRVFLIVGRGLAILAVMLVLHVKGAAAQPRTLKFQAVVPTGMIIWDAFKDFTERAEKMSGGRLKIEPIPAGVIVPPFEVLDAVSRGIVDGGYSAPAYHTGKDLTAGLFGASPCGPFGFDDIDYMGWIYWGGGLELFNELYQEVLHRNVVVFPIATCGPQPLGWFGKPFKSLDGFKALKGRQVGLTAMVLSRIGMKVVATPAGEILQAAERGIIDCAELTLPAEDLKMGLHKIWKYYYMPSLHEPATVIELLINRDVWNGLSPDLQEIIKNATLSVTYQWRSKYHKLNGIAMKELEKEGVQIVKTPDYVLKAILEAWDKIADEESAKNPFFKKVYESMRAYAALTLPARYKLYGNQHQFAVEHYWPEKK